MRYLLVIFCVVATGALAKQMSCLELLRAVPLANSVKAPRVALDVAGITQRMKNVQRRFPERVQLTQYGSVKGFDLLKIHVPSSNPNAVKVVITAGIHGNEVLGPLTALEFLEKSLRQKGFSDRFDITIYPLANPRALERGKRRRLGVDLNRIFDSDSDAPEVNALSADLVTAKFDVGLDLHGAPLKEKFFVIKTGDDAGIAAEAVARLPKEFVLESNTGEYPGRSGIRSDPERYEMLVPGVVTSSLPGTLKTFLKERVGVPYAYTLEYPHKLDTEQAVRSYVDLVDAFLVAAESRKLPKR